MDFNHPSETRSWSGDNLKTRWLTNSRCYMKMSKIVSDFKHKKDWVEIKLTLFESYMGVRHHDTISQKQDPKVAIIWRLSAQDNTWKHTRSPGGGVTLHMTGYTPEYTKSVEKGSFFWQMTLSFAKRVYFSKDFLKDSVWIKILFGEMFYHEDVMWN